MCIRDSSSLGNWPSPAVFVSPAEAPNFDYLVFTNSGNFGHDYVSGEEVLLFTFENVGNCTGPAEIMLVDDPFINNTSANVGPAFAILGFGNRNAFAGAYEVGNANCSGGGEDCGSSSISNVFSVNERTCEGNDGTCLLYTSPSPRDRTRSRMPSSA